jgi:hypothetical protein
MLVKKLRKQVAERIKKLRKQLRKRMAKASA